MKTWLRDIFMNVFSFLLGTKALILPKQKGLILFGAHNGNRFSDNPAVLYQHVLKNNKELRPVWLTNNNDVIDQVKKLGGEAYKRRSLKGIWLSLITPIYITSHNVKDVLMYIPFKKTPKHIYLHHGIPLRKGWLDLKDAPKKSKKSSLDKIESSNYMIAPSKYAAEQQNKLLPIGINHFAITGLPRNDIFFDNSFDVEKFKRRFELNDFNKVVLYGPTWRPWGATQFFPFADYKIDELVAFLQKENICLVLRPHHVDLKSTDNKDFWESIRGINNIKLITHDLCPDVNEMCMISDALITDYSSMYYDYLIQDKPVVFLIYDYDRYNKEIGFYPDFQKITHGHKPDSQQSFIQALLEISEGKDTFAKERNDLKDRFYLNLDGNSSQRVTKLIIDLIK